MDGVTVRGRSWTKPEATVTAETDGTVIRLDDDVLPEHWMEVRISGPALVELLMQVLAVRGGPVQGYYIALEALQIALRR